MKRDARRVLLALSTAGAMIVSAPAAGYAHSETLSGSGLQITAYQEASDNDSVAASETAFIRTAVSDAATELEAARLARERAADPVVRQFATNLANQYQDIIEDAEDVAERVDVDVRRAPTDDDESALIAALRDTSGQEFDETYLRAFVQDQRVALKDYLTARDEMDGEVSKYADRHAGMMSNQLRAAIELATRLGVEIEES